MRGRGPLQRWLPQTRRTMRAGTVCCGSGAAKRCAADKASGAAAACVRSGHAHAVPRLLPPGCVASRDKPARQCPCRAPVLLPCSQQQPWAEARLEAVATQAGPLAATAAGLQELAQSIEQEHALALAQPPLEEMEAVLDALLASMAEQLAQEGLTGVVSARLVALLQFWIDGLHICDGCAQAGCLLPGHVNCSL